MSLALTGMKLNNRDLTLAPNSTGKPVFLRKLRLIYRVECGEVEHKGADPARPNIRFTKRPDR